MESETATLHTEQGIASAVAEQELESLAEQGTESSSLAETDRLMLRTEGLVKRYGKRTVVNDVAFDVKQGEIVGLLGPNGAGKTTSIYMTTGLVVPNEGHICSNNLFHALLELLHRGAIHS